MIIQWLLVKIIDFFPSVNLPEGAIAGLSTISSWAGFANYYLPLDTFFNCLLTFLGVCIICAIVSFFLQAL